MDRSWLRGMIVGAGMAGLAAVANIGAAQAQEYAAVLNGFSETGLLPPNEEGAILTTGTGQLLLDVDRKTQTATYTLSFSNLTSLATMAHIHFGQEHVPGNIMIWLCQTHVMRSPVPGTPFCPRIGGMVSGTISGGSIVAIPTQNVTAGNFGALVAALDGAAAYANVHSVDFPLGEIRGQISRLPAGR